MVRPLIIRDWSLLPLTEEGGATKRECGEGGACEVLPLGKGAGDGKSFSHAEEGGTTSYEVPGYRTM